MTSTKSDVFDRATRTSHAWLDAVAAELGTSDTHAAYRILRAWMHTFRDRLPVDKSADFAAGLPELLRGVYFEGWRPGHVPVKFGAEEYRRRFAEEAGITTAEVAEVAPVVTGALRGQLATGQLDRALAQLPSAVRGLVDGDGRTAGDGGRDAWIRALDVQMEELVTAVKTLTHSLQHPPDGRDGGTGPAPKAAAARTAGPSGSSPLGWTD
ncbi:DUF2267 domain-containing protein [Dactylosporangium sp. NPDC050688]|uniref:DUF2267 domain-containing protein n=1 Tax=Dactylosporangium sp. NPDC050688 TaxID=3157217 RepID=UPI0033FB7090